MIVLGYMAPREPLSWTLTQVISGIYFTWGPENLAAFWLAVKMLTCWVSMVFTI